MELYPARRHAAKRRPLGRFCHSVNSFNAARATKHSLIPTPSGARIRAARRSRQQFKTLLGIFLRGARRPTRTCNQDDALCVLPSVRLRLVFLRRRPREAHPFRAGRCYRQFRDGRFVDRGECRRRARIARQDQAPYPQRLTFFRDGLNRTQSVAVVSIPLAARRAGAFAGIGRSSSLVVGMAHQPASLRRNVARSTDRPVDCRSSSDRAIWGC